MPKEIKKKSNGSLYPSQAGNGKQLVQSDQKLPQQILQLLVELCTVFLRKLLLPEIRRTIDRGRGKARGEPGALTLKNSSRSAASVSSVRTSEWKLSTVL